MYQNIYIYLDSYGSYETIAGKGMESGVALCSGSFVNNPQTMGSKVFLCLCEINGTRVCVCPGTPVSAKLVPRHLHPPFQPRLRVLAYLGCISIPMIHAQPTQLHPELG